MWRYCMIEEHMRGTCWSEVALIVVAHMMRVEWNFDISMSFTVVGGYIEINMKIEVTNHKNMQHKGDALYHS